MNNLLIIAGSACFALVFQESGITFKLKRYLKQNRLKPFDCVFCLAWWLGIAGAIFFGKNTVEWIYVGSISAITAVFLSKNLNK
jgi:hypothetical protein